MKQLIFILFFPMCLFAQTDTMIVKTSAIKTVSGKKITTLNLKEITGKVVVEKTEDLSKEDIITRLQMLSKDTANCNMMIRQMDDMEIKIREERRKQVKAKRTFDRIMERLNNILNQMYYETSNIHYHNSWSFSFNFRLPKGRNW